MTDTTTAIARGETPIADGLERRNHQRPQSRLAELADAASVAADASAFTAHRVAEHAANPLYAAFDAAGVGNCLTPDEITVLLRVAEAFEAAHRAQPQMMP